MEVYSLEEEDVGDMFLTQESRNIVSLVPNFEVENEEVTGESNLTELGVVRAEHYSDISDAEDFEIPCSQISQNHVQQR